MIEYNEIPFRSIAIKDVSFGYRCIGKGEDLVFIHGFPTHGYTWRKLLPELSQSFKCHILDMPGLGISEWSTKSNLRIDKLDDKNMIVSTRSEGCAMVNIRNYQNDTEMNKDFFDAIRFVTKMFEEKFGGCRISSNIGDYQTSKHLHWYVHCGEAIRETK